MRGARERLNALASAVSAQDEAHASALDRGARNARALMLDLDEITRRLTYVLVYLKSMRTMY